MSEMHDAYNAANASARALIDLKGECGAAFYGEEAWSGVDFQRALQPFWERSLKLALKRLGTARDWKRKGIFF
jgi:hypothetical protein